MDRYVHGYPYAKAALEMALYDIAGHYLDQPLTTLLGGTYRTKIAVHGGVGIADMEDMVADAAELAEAGFKAIKVKVGIDLLKDLELVQRVREAIGPERLIIVDANQGYSRKTALVALKKMENHYPLMAEQPLHADDIESLATITRDVKIPIIADEAVWSPADALRVAAARAADIFHIYVLKSGGLFRARACIQIAEAAHIPCNVGGMIDLGIGTAAELHLSAALRNVRPDIAPCGIFGPYFLEDDIITEQFVMKDGDLTVPTGPGLGIQIDQDKLRYYQKRVISDYA
jgi:muconate cycloisomerase